MSLISIGEAKLYTQSHGSGDVVLLVPGLGGSAKFWVNQVAPLSEHFRVVLHDHRGVGRSGPAPTIDGVRTLAEDALALMDKLDIAQAHLVGHSTGGAIGQHIALIAPRRLKSLVLSASWAGPTALFLDTFRARRSVLTSSGAANYLLLGTLLVTPAWWLEDRFAGAEEFLKTRLEDFPGLETELNRLDAVMTHDLRSRLGEINVPTTVICAQDDQLTPPGMSRELAEGIPGARLEMLQRGGHFSPVTVAERYNEVLLRALLGD